MEITVIESHMMFVTSEISSFALLIGRTMFITSEISSFALLIGRTGENLSFAFRLTDIPQNLT